MLELSRDTLEAAFEAALRRLYCQLRPDFLAALEAAYAALDNGESGSDTNGDDGASGRWALGQLVENARMAGAQRLPICQDTGYVWACLEVGGDVRLSADVLDGLDAICGRVYTELGLRKSLLHDALFDRTNSGDNTPVMKEVRFVGSTGAEPSAILHVMLKGGGSDNASKLTMLAPGAGVEGVVEFVLQAVREKAANACPPLVVGVGVGGTFDKVAGLAKHALLRKVELTAITVGTPSTTPGSAKPGQNHPLEKGELKALEERLLKEVNALGIGPGGFGGWPTALAVHVETAPCHIAALPVAVNMGCSAMRSSSIDLLSGEVLV